MDALRKAIIWMIEEGAGELDDSQQAVLDAYNDLPDAEVINIEDYQDDPEDDEY